MRRAAGGDRPRNRGTRCRARVRGLLAALLLALASVGGGAAQVVERIGASAGLGAEMITALYQDRAGFLWVGTRQGLYVFDGAGFRRYEHDPEDPRSLADSAVRTVFEDGAGRLWVGTNTGGLDRLDRASGVFHHHRHDPADPASIGHDSVNAVAEEADGTLWVATQRGLDRLDPARGSFTRVLPGPGAPPLYVYSLLAAPGGALWAGTVGGGLFARDPASGRFARIAGEAAPPGEGPVVDAFVLLPGGPEGLWLGSQRGLCRFDTGTGSARCVLPDAPRGAAPGESSETVTSLAPGPDGTIWVGALGGLTEFDPATGAFRKAVEIDDREHPGRRSRITCLLRDRAGDLWIGTWEDGLMRRRAGAAPFLALDHAPRHGPGESDVTALLEDCAGRLWLATSGGGLYLRERGEEDFRYYEPLAAAQPPGSTASLVRLREGSGGEIWVGSSGALFRIDPRRQAVERLVHDERDPSSLGPGIVSALATTRDGTLWVGTGRGGLQRMRPDGRSFDRFVHDPARDTTISDDYVTAIHEARDGRLLVGTRAGGLNLFDRRTETFQRGAAGPGARGAPGALGHPSVTSILELPDGTAWVGTGGGLHRMARGAPGAPPRFERVTARDGLAGDGIMALGADDDGNLWVSTREGLSRFDPRRRLVRNYDAADGLPSAEFDPGAVASGATDLYFGTIKGAIALQRGSPFPAVVPAPTVLTSIRSLQGPVVAAAPVWALGELTVPYGEALIVDFAVLDYADPARHRYAYRLDGSDDAWVDLGTTRTITFNRLDPGRHELRVKGRDAAGVWSEIDRPLVLRVVPPFWMTAWFRALVAVGLVALAYAGLTVRTRALERRNRELLELHEQRAQALAESREKEERLREAYERLRALSRRLEAAKEDERRRIARELHDEMGQALTAAKITIDLAERAAGVRAAGGGMEGAASLIDRIIDQVRDLSLDLRPPLLDERGLIPALRGYLEARARSSGVEIAVSAGEGVGRFAPELEIAAFRVVQEAVTNALRHAGAARIAVALERGADRIELTVRDDGRGFDVPEALARAAAGRHLGLLGIRERVESLGGRVELGSSPGHGTEIRATLPLEPPS